MSPFIYIHVCVCVCIYLLHVSIYFKKIWYDTQFPVFHPAQKFQLPFHREQWKRLSTISKTWNKDLSHASIKIVWRNTDCFYISKKKNPVLHSISYHLSSTKTPTVTWKKTSEKVVNNFRYSIQIIRYKYTNITRYIHRRQRIKRQKRASDKSAERKNVRAIF